jgi:hypothetical protein
MKAIVIPGVGKQKDERNLIKNFCSNIRNRTGYEAEIFRWDHDHDYVYDQGSLKYSLLRNKFTEGIMDFQYVIFNASSIEMPEADVYIGHSAGSILSIMQSKHKCVTMGSPLPLVGAIYHNLYYNFSHRSLNELIKNVYGSKRKILNIINSYDIVAYPYGLENADVENYTYKTCFFNFKNLNPWYAHENYWSNNDVMDKIVNFLKEEEK